MAQYASVTCTQIPVSALIDTYSMLTESVDSSVRLQCCKIALFLVTIF